MELSNHLCECGCGNPTPLYTRSRGKGKSKGQPLRRIRGHEKAAPIDQRFWSKVDINGPTPKHRPELGPCWVWTGALAGKLKSARLVVKGKQVPGTHVAIYLATGKWPTLSALHKCDNGACVRFSHLFEGTQKENIEDMVRKGRTTAKLTGSEVKEIIKSLDQGITQRPLANKYNVSQCAISRIKRNLTWKRIPRRNHNE